MGYDNRFWNSCILWELSTPGGTPYIRMMGIIVVFFRGCNRWFSFLGDFKAKSIKKINRYLLGNKNFELL